MSDFDNEPTWPKSLIPAVDVEFDFSDDDEVTEPTGATKLIRAVELLPTCKCGRFDLGCAEKGCGQ